MRTRTIGAAVLAALLLGAGPAAAGWKVTRHSSGYCQGSEVIDTFRTHGVDLFLTNASEHSIACPLSLDFGCAHFTVLPVVNDGNPSEDFECEIAGYDTTAPYTEIQAGAEVVGSASSSGTGQQSFALPIVPHDTERSYHLRCDVPEPTAADSDDGLSVLVEYRVVQFCQ